VTAATNALIATTLLLDALQKAAQIGASLRKAEAEGRDISDAELDELRAIDDQARQRLVAAIAADAAGSAPSP
jgi:hypothetical protein